MFGLVVVVVAGGRVVDCLSLLLLLLLFVCLCVCLLVCLFVCLFVCLLACLLACLRACMYVCLRIPSLVYNLPAPPPVLVENTVCARLIMSCRHGLAFL